MYFECVSNGEQHGLSYRVQVKNYPGILKVIKFGGILTTVLTITADALGYCNNFPDFYKGVIGTSGVWGGVLTGIAEKRVRNTKNPYTYLAHINSNFSLFPGANRDFVGQPLTARYNYTLYRGIEEFIKD